VCVCDEIAHATRQRVSERALRLSNSKKVVYGREKYIETREK